MFADPNGLLFIISGRGTMTWADYCEAVDFLAADRLGESRLTSTRSGLLHCLEALGHCDSHYNEGHSTIAVTPPALCRLPRAGLPIAVLTGARCLQTQQQLAEAAKTQGGAVQITVKRYAGPLGLLPDTVLVKSESAEALADFSTNLGLACPPIPPAWTFMNWCGTLEEYEANIDYRIPEQFNWARYDFCVSSLTFVRTLSSSNHRFSRYLNPRTKLPMHVFFRDDSGAEVDLKWGRYLLLNAMGIMVTAYDEKRFRLCVPVTVPLPTIVARTVCLCSGNPPIYLFRPALLRSCACDDWLMFEDVPPQIAIAAMAKVGQSPVMVDIL